MANAFDLRSSRLADFLIREGETPRMQVLTGFCCIGRSALAASRATTHLAPVTLKVFPLFQAEIQACGGARVFTSRKAP